MKPFEDKLFVGTRAGVPAIFNGTDCGICVATVATFPFDPACTVPEDYARMFAAAPKMLAALRRLLDERVCLVNAHGEGLGRYSAEDLSSAHAAIAEATSPRPQGASEHRHDQARQGGAPVPAPVEESNRA